LYSLNSEIKDIDGIIRIKIDIPFDVKFVCIYIFDVNGQKFMIDSGFNMLAWKKRFLQALEEINLNLKEIDYCLVTHEHLDHSGLVKYFKRINPNMQIMMHEITDESLHFGSDEDYAEIMEQNALKVAEEVISYGMNKSQIMRLLKGFLVWPKIVRYSKPDRILNDDDELHFKSTTLKIIQTPGHSLGHICVFDTQKKYLFSGDHILSRITPHVGIYHISTLINEKRAPPNILESYLKSLDKILQLNPKLIFPAHQDIIENPHERIIQIQKHHHSRFNEIRKTINTKPLTPFEISKIHFGSDLDDINTYLALNEVLSHLIYLEQQGKVKRIEKHGKTLFCSDCREPLN